MNEELIRVKIGYTKLTESQKDDFKKFIKEYDGKSYHEKSTLNENLKRSLGPIDSAKCPCCGK